MNRFHTLLSSLSLIAAKELSHVVKEVYFFKKHVVRLIKKKHIVFYCLVMPGSDLLKITSQKELEDINAKVFCPFLCII